MKTIQRITSLLLAMMLLLTLLPMGLTATADTPDGYGRSILAQMDNADALLYAYDVIAAASYGTPGSISLSHATHKVTWEEACTVYDLVLNDHPDIFWHGNGYSGSVYGGYAIALKPTYTLTGADLEAAQAALESRVTALTADLAGKSDYEKSLLLHDRLAAATNYEMLGSHQTVYGALVQGTAVCAGYARAYQLLMQRVGIPAWYVTGTSIAPSGQLVGHAWNLVQLDGQWYYTDVTWDDQNSYTFYSYLNNTYEQITASHTVGNYVQYLPDATATQHNYFVKNDLQMEQYSVEAMAEIFRNHYPPRVYITGDKATFLKEYTSHLLELCDALNAPPGTIRYGSASLGNEVIFTLQIDHTCQYTTHIVLPTCTADGYTVEVCTYAFCHNEHNRVVLPANGHIYDNGCDTDCNACGAIREVAGHVYDNACDSYCNECGVYRISDEHEYVLISEIAPTCGTAGEHVYACIACGDSFVVGFPPVGTHDYDNACDTDCNDCGAIREAEHTYITTDIFFPSCTEAGYTEYTCGLCGEINTVPIPATGHTYDNDTATQCNVCGAARPTHKPGDLNGDGKINVRDLGVLQQFINGWNVPINTAAADVNGDGKLNVRDLGLLQQFINGWDVTLK